LQCCMKKRCLARSHWACHYSESFTLQDTLQKNLERGAMWISQMKESGVRGETERFFFELIKGRVQIDLPGVPNG
jgi:hypothetical protein